MSTRCTLTIRDSDQALTIYRHSDGYPDTEHGVLATLTKAFTYAWPLPRFEADDFAAAIVAAWKLPARESSHGYVSQGGDIRLMTGDRDSVCDSEFHYEISHAGHRNKVKVVVFSRKRDDTWKLAKTRLVATPPVATTDATKSKLHSALAGLMELHRPTQARVVTQEWREQMIANAQSALDVES